MKLRTIFGTIAAALVCLTSASADWILDRPEPEKNNVILTDGNWVLKGTLSGTKISVTGKNSVDDPTTLDLRQPVTDGDTATYIITSVSGFSSTAGLVNLYLPDTLTSISSFHDCADLTTIDPFLPSTVTSIGAGAFYACKKLEGDLVIDNASPVSLPWHGNNGWGMFQGTSLRSVTITSPVKQLSGRMFLNCTNLEWAILPGTIPALGQGYCLSDFGNCTSLTNLTFLGDCPTASSLTSALPDLTTYQTRICIPRFNPSWQAFIEGNANITLATEADLATFAEKYPDDTVPPYAVWNCSGTRIWIMDRNYFGDNALYVTSSPVPAGDVTPAYGSLTIVENGDTVTCTAPATAEYDGTLYFCTGSILETETSLNVWSNPITQEGNTRVFEQTGPEAKRITWLWAQSGYFLNAQTYGGGSGTVTYDPASTILEGVYQEGTRVTLTATPAPGSRFVRWFGDVPEDHATQPTLSITVNSDLSCRPIFSNPWVRNGDTITDGNWTLNLNYWQSQGTNIAISGVASVAAREVLDLSTPVSNADGTTSYNIVGLSGAFQFSDLTHLYLPDCLQSIGGEAFMNSGLQTIEPFFPSSLNSIGQAAFYNCQNLTGDLVLDSPDPVALPWHGNKGWGTFENTAIRSVNITSPITQVSGCMFKNCKNLEWATIPETLPTFGQGYCNEDFGYCTSLTNLYFLGNCPNAIQSALPKLTDYQTRIYAPRGEDSWIAFAEENITPLTEDLKEIYRERYPNDPLPRGVYTISPTNHIWYMLWTPPKSRLRTTIIYFK